MAKGIATVPTDKEYEIQNAADTLMRAEQIRQEPKMFAGARKELEKRRKAIVRASGKTPPRPAPKRKASKKTSRRSTRRRK